MTGRSRQGAASWAFAALVVAILAVGFRCWRLSSVPPGLYVDEVLTARNALAWRLDPHATLLGSRPLLMPGWVETSNLYLAFASAVLALGGDGLLGVRLLSVLPSLAAVPLLYLLGSQLGDRRTGLLATFLVACSHWAARSGRTGWDAVLMVTLQLAALACLAAAVRRGRLAPALVAGALLGLAFYSYVAASLVLLQAVVWMGWEAVAAWRSRAVAAVGAERAETASGTVGAGIGDPSAVITAPPKGVGATSFRDACARLVVCVAAALAVAAPLLLRLGRASTLLPVRVTELSVLARHGPGEPWLALGRNLARHLLMFHLRGGSYARDALPGFPMLDPLTGVLLLAGVGVAVACRGWRRRLLLSWPLVMLLGGVLSSSGEGPPYPYRVLSLAPWACLTAALGGVALWEAWRPRLAAPWRGAMLAAALLAVVMVNGWVLFVAGPADPGTQRVYGTAATRLGRWLAVHRDGRPVMLLAGALREPALPAGYRFAAANGTNFFRLVDSAAAVQLAAGVYAERPWRALDPLRPAGDVDLMPALPERLTALTLLVLAPEEQEAAARRFRVERRIELRATDGSAPATILLLRP